MHKLAYLAVASIVMAAAIAACGDDGTDCDDVDCACLDGGCGGSGPGATTGAPASNSAALSGSTTATKATSTNATSSGPPDVTSSGSGMADAEVNLTFSGTCAPDFSGTLVVASNADSTAVTATTVFSSVQLALESSGTIQLSTAERVANGDVINLVSQGVTWTNISSADPDPISGSLVVNEYQEQAGIFDVDFHGVVLQNVADASLCTIDGSLRAFGNSF